MTDAGTDGAKGWAKYGMPEAASRFRSVGRELAALMKACAERVAAKNQTDPAEHSLWKDAIELETGLSDGSLRLSEVESYKIRNWIRDLDALLFDPTNAASVWGAYGTISGDDVVYWDFGYASDPPYDDQITQPKVDHGPFETWLTTCGNLADAELYEKLDKPFSPMFRGDWAKQLHAAFNRMTTAIAYPRTNGGAMFNLSGGAVYASGWTRPVRAFEGYSNADETFIENTTGFCQTVQPWTRYEDSEPPKIQAFSPEAGIYLANTWLPAGTVVRGRMTIVHPKDICRRDSKDGAPVIAEDDCEQIEFDPLGSGVSEGSSATIEFVVPESGVRSDLLFSLAGPGGSFTPETLHLPPIGERLEKPSIFGFGVRFHYQAYDYSKAFEFVEPEG